MAQLESSASCPRCQYDLTGLPEIHTCPECGFDYDSNAIFVRLKIGRILWNQLLMAALLIGAMIYFATPKTRWKENFAPISLIMLSIIPVILRLLSSRDRGSLTLNRFGVTKEKDQKRVIRIPWNEIQRVRFNWITDNVVVKRNRSKRIVVSTHQLVVLPVISND
ncbi:MAG: hypothetical protein HY287_15955 [Planctomycetes bacterium]|nr:hypothetical protein [Planctomycetota bacterium]